MSRLYLIRHGSTSWTGARYCGRSDPPLDARGRSQAKALADALARERLDRPRIVSSPAARCRETAAAIAGRLDRELVLDERLREADFGAAEGLTFDELERRFPTVARTLLSGDARVDWPWGDRASDLATRLESVARELDAAREADAVVVSHGGPLRVLAELLGLRPETTGGLAPAQILVLERNPRWHAVSLIADPMT